MGIAMRTSPAGLTTLALREGRRLKAYRDSVGVWTIGVGHTSAAGPPEVTPGLTITDAECDAIFARDIVRYEDAVNAAVAEPIPQGAYDALVSLCYNIGPRAFAGSTVVRRLNAGDWHGAADAILLWDKPAEIMGRRRSEHVQFLAAYATPAPHAPSPPTSHPLLARGDHGAEVKAAQAILARLGLYAGRIDGGFGPQTEIAVRSFQAQHRLFVDGRVGPNTWAALLAA